MHGRLKVRTSEEEKERKKKEQALKVKAYKAAMTKISAKRQQNELDDELLQVTAQILLRNPDVATLWNIRRECVLEKVKAMSADADEQEANKQAVFDAELAMTEQCLMVNPKSYNGWHHRCWSLEQSPQANWEREMQLCNKYLKLDERNFHTWDYRRYVAQKAGVSKQQELDFCTEKIKTNFSNYSSWHYRSQLLPVLHPYEGDALPKRPMSECKLKEELEMVITAAFTDPNDSSAWFYQRWLLGYSRPELQVAAFRCDGDKAVLALTKPMPSKNIELLLCNESGEQLAQLNKWQTANKTAADVLLLCAMPKQLNLQQAKQLKVHVPTMNCEALALQAHAESLYFIKAPNRCTSYSEPVLQELRAQLESCSSLLEYEPDSKWTLLTSALLMRAIDSVAYHEQTLQYLEKLQQVDVLREGYYKDLAAKWLMEKLLSDWCDSQQLPKQLCLQQQHKLASLSYAQYLCIADEVLLPSHLEQIYKNKLKTFQTLQL